ncbi:hypothetical protein SNEBB_009191 [Seison nebaliae]|nr:hypothetical protein SNEBB_009191 [Seison nebaliae]
MLPSTTTITIMTNIIASSTLSNSSSSTTTTTTTTGIYSTENGERIEGRILSGVKDEDKSISSLRINLIKSKYLSSIQSMDNEMRMKEFHDNSSTAGNMTTDDDEGFSSQHNDIDSISNMSDITISSSTSSSQYFRHSNVFKLKAKYLLQTSNNSFGDGKREAFRPKSPFTSDTTKLKATDEEEEEEEEGHLHRQQSKSFKDRCKLKNELQSRKENDEYSQLSYERNIDDDITEYLSNSRRAFSLPREQNLNIGPRNYQMNKKRLQYVRVSYDRIRRGKRQSLQTTSDNYKKSNNSHVSHLIDRFSLMSQINHSIPTIITTLSSSSTTTTTTATTIIISSLTTSPSTSTTSYNNFKSFIMSSSSSSSSATTTTTISVINGMNRKKKLPSSSVDELITITNNNSNNQIPQCKLSPLSINYHQSKNEEEENMINIKSSCLTRAASLRDCRRRRCSYNSIVNDNEPAQSFRPSDFHIGPVIGTGFFGIVYLVRHIKSGMEMVLKEMLRFDDEARQSFLQEVHLMRELRHPNVLRFIGIMWSNEHRLNLVVDYISGGTVKDLIHNIDIHLPWLRRVRIASDISAGMEYLHSMRIIHRDLNPNNCLIREDGTVVVADFGLSRIVLDDDHFYHSISSNEHTDKYSRKSLQRCQKYTVVGSPYWMAPEMLNGRAYDERVDIFSFGIILCEIIGRVQADPDCLPRTSDFGLNVELFKKKFCPEDCDKSFIRIAVCCCQTEVERRPPFSRSRPWLETIAFHLDIGRNIPKEFIRSICPLD